MATSLETSADAAAKSEAHPAFTAANADNRTVDETTKKRPFNDETNNDVADDDKNSAGTTNDSGNKSGYKSTLETASGATLQPLLQSSLYNMVDGLPRTEMKLIVEEAKKCEQALEEELKILKEALEKEQNTKPQATEEKTKNESGSEEQFAVASSVDQMLESDVTPPDHYWTVSSLLGRLRHDLTTPLPPNSQLRFLREAQPTSKKRKSNTGNAVASGEDGTASGRSTPNFSAAASLNNGFNTETSQFERFQQIQDHPDFKVEHENPDKLLVLQKKITTHKSSLVFRRPVNPKDAPGYSDRIRFPMDLSLIRKLIVNRTIRSYHDIAKRIHLICHNCIKYNGRESDYALVTREFESCSAEYLIHATLTHSNPNAVPNPFGRQGKKRSNTPTAGTSSTNVSRTTTPKEGMEQTDPSMAQMTQQQQQQKGTLKQEQPAK